MEVIIDKALLRLCISIFAIRYLEKRAFCFIKIIGDNKKTNEEADRVSNLEKKIQIKKALYKEKKNIRALLLATACPFAPLSVFIYGLSAFSTSTILMARLSTPPSMFVTAMLVFKLSATLFALLMLILGSSTLLSTTPMSLLRS